MFKEALIDRPWTRLDKKRLEKMEYAFYMLKETCDRKKKAIERAYYGEELAGWDDVVFDVTAAV
jgi:hypothetical protein